MTVKLKKLELYELPMVKHWHSQAGAFYTLRYGPKHFDGVETCKAGQYAWFIIQAENLDVGVIWLEKLYLFDDSVVLGIMLGQSDSFGRGIGRLAIGGNGREIDRF